MSKSAETKKYMPLVGAAGIGSMLGSGIIIGLSATITVWQSGLGLTDGQVGILSGALTFAIAAGSKHRNKFFYVGIVIQAGAMIGIALGGGTIAMIVGMIACYNIGNQFAGESIYKVWTQESFPVEARASMQEFINGFSRFCCGLFALVTPYLVAGDRIHTTMYGFAGIVLISAVAGTRMIVLQKKHGVGQM